MEPYNFFKFDISESLVSETIFYFFFYFGIALVVKICTSAPLLDSKSVTPAAACKDELCARILLTMLNKLYLVINIIIKIIKEMTKGATAATVVCITSDRSHTQASSEE